MTLNDFNNIRLEYSLGARVIMFSLIDISANKSVLTPTNVSKIIIEYDYNDDNTYTYEQGLSFHCNSCLIILTGLQENTDINFKVYLSYEENNEELYRIAITDVINEHTLPLGNITYTILDRESLQTNIINQLTSTMDDIVSYINNLGTYVDESYDEYAIYARNIPVEYDSTIATANAFYYKYYDIGSGCFGRVKTSGGSYFKNDVMYHELRHRYGIGSNGTNITRNDDYNSSMFNFVEDKFSILHNALKFESGRSDAKVWIFGGHSNILEGNYTNTGDYNYLAANYIKALAWYTCHSIQDQDTSKIRVEVPLHIVDTAKEFANIQWKIGDDEISSVEKTYGEDLSSIYLSAPTETINDIIYNSSNINVATFDNNHNIIYGSTAGKTIISASLNDAIDYFDDYDEFELTVNKIQTELYWKENDVTITNISKLIDDNVSDIHIESSTSIDLTTINYSSSNDNVVKVNNGVLEIIGGGVCIITATYNGDDTHEPCSISLHIIIKTVPNLTWYNSSININNQIFERTFDNNLSLIYLKKPENINTQNIIYSSSDESVVTIDSNGKITKVGLGTTIITADFSGDDYYLPESSLFTLKLNEIPDVNEDIKKSSNKHNAIDYSKIKTINIGPYQYLYEYLKNDEDFYDVGCSDSFVILRNFDIVNNIIYDKDIFFIEKSIYNKLIDSNSNDLICYPLYKDGSLFFSDVYGYFVKYNISLKDISYQIYNEDENNNEIEANILCDKLRIYNPVINKNMDFITYIDNHINNIHFHYFCNLNKNFKKHYTNEIKVNNDRYIEYIEINVPNIKKLFNGSNNYYIKEDFNKVYFERDFTLKSYLDNLDQEKEYSNKLYLSKMIKPFLINKVNKDDHEIYVKTYIDDKYFNYNSNYINTSLNITIYPYTGISNNVYILHDVIGSSSTFITYENYFRLSSHLGFYNGVISLINEFIFPNKIRKNDENYLKHYDYSENETSRELEEDKQVTEEYNTYFLHENINNLDDFKDEFDEELNVEGIRSTGFLIEIATDINFNDIVLQSVINTDNNNDNFIYDFSFSLNNMVDNWSQLNDILIVRSKFIDKRLNIVITGNNVVITKEWFKYFINDTNDYIINFDKTNNLIENMNTSYFNFIDHINCTITENNNEKTINSLNNNVTNTKLIYKPIFYKVQDLQTLRIRQGITQKIGINLGDYINKINTFILNIGELTIKEYARNDVFVIFEINSNNIDDNTGYYNILNEDFEYISSGNYIKY